MINTHSYPRIVILGAGFGGIETATTLAKKLPRGQGEIILIDMNNFLLFTPLLIEVMSGQVDMLHIVSATRQLNKRIRFEQGRVVGIDLDNKRVDVISGGTGYGDPALHRSFEADHLVIALGAIPNFYKIPGLSTYSNTMKNLCDAVGIRNRALALLEAANCECDPEKRKKLLSFVIGGGGFSGVETAGGLLFMLQDAARFYPNVKKDDIKITIVEAKERLLPELKEDLANYAQRRFDKDGIDVILNTMITQATKDGIILSDGREIECTTIIWTGGVSPTTDIKNLNCEHGKHGGIIVDQTLAVPGHPGVWAVGDCAEVPLPDKSGTYGPTAQNATRQGKLAALNIIASINGQKAKPYKYKTIGEVAVLGRRSGVASIFGIHLVGFIAWFMWRTIYLLKMPGLKKRIHIGIDWMVDLLFGREIVEMPTQCFIAGICGSLDEAESELTSHNT